MGLKKNSDNSEWKTSARTGIGAGEEIDTGKSTTFLGETVKAYGLTYENKTKEYFFHNKEKSGSACNCGYNIWFDPANADGWDSYNSGSADLDNVLLLLKSVKWL